MSSWSRFLRRRNTHRGPRQQLPAATRRAASTPPAANPPNIPLSCRCAAPVRTAAAACGSRRRPVFPQADKRTAARCGPLDALCRFEFCGSAAFTRRRDTTPRNDGSRSFTRTAPHALPCRLRGCSASSRCVCAPTSDAAIRGRRSQRPVPGDHRARACPRTPCRQRQPTTRVRRWRTAAVRRRARASVLTPRPTTTRCDGGVHLRHGRQLTELS